MVVLRLIGDEWNYNEKIALAVPPAKTFNMCAIDLRNKLQIPSWNGCALYFTEGRPPHYVRATIPINMNSNCAKEGLKDGSILYVKTNCDLTRQELDKKFHAALEQWRQETKVPCIEKDGGDVIEFTGEYFKRLAPDASKDVNDHESEKRAVIEGEENRLYFAMTFEYREIQKCKDDETHARGEICDEYVDQALKGYREMIWHPLRKDALRQFVEKESVRRNAIGDEEGSDRAILLRRLSDGSGELKAAALKKEEAEQGAATKIVVEPTLATNTPAGVAVSFDTSGLAMQLQTALSQLSAEMRRESNDIRQLVHHVVEAHTQSTLQLAQTYERMNEVIEERHVKNVQRALETTILHESMPHTLRMQTEEEAHLLEQNQLLRDIIAEETLAAKNLHADQQKLENEFVSHMLAIATAGQEDIQQLVQATMESLKEKESQVRALVIKNHELTTEVRIHELAAEQQELEAQELQRTLKKYEEQVIQGSRFAMEVVVNGTKWTEEVAYCGLHPDVYDLFCEVAKRRVPIPAGIYEHVLGYPIGSPVRRPDPLTVAERRAHDENVVRQSTAALNFFRDTVSDLALLCGGCPHLMADELCWRYGITTHPMRKRFLAVMDDTQPHLSCAVDVLLDLYSGREAELMVFLQRVNLDDFMEYTDDATGMNYYYHRGVDMTQWLAPEAQPLRLS